MARFLIEVITETRREDLTHDDQYTDLKLHLVDFMPNEARQIKGGFRVFQVIDRSDELKD